MWFGLCEQGRRHILVGSFYQARRQGAVALVHLQEAFTVSASGDDALDVCVVGQVAHGVLNVHADALALDIKARSREEI